MRRLQSFLIREFRALFLIMTAGGALVMISIVILWVRGDASGFLAAAGVKILYFGYPVYALFRILRLFFGKKN